MRASSHRIGDYIPLRTLGVGAVGKVKLARHVHTGQYVALKIIRKDVLETKRTLHQKVRREIAVMKLVAGNCRQLHRRRRAASPHKFPPAPVGVMHLLDVYDTEHSFVLVLEYCEGGELFDLLVQRGHLPLPLVLDYFQQLVYALEFCHNRGVCHRDLKLENVLLTADGRVKLADFGMASLLTPGSLLETSCGSPQYCAPEVILGDLYQGGPADVWSLGVVLFAMTTGGLPFDDDNLRRLINKVQSGAFYLPPEVPEELADLIRSMLTVEPSKRATLADIKKSEWFTSRPCRKDIYREDSFELTHVLPACENEPVTDPDVTILRYLADLGLGDCPIIRRRLSSADRSLERDFYYQLAEFCRDSLAFRSVDDLPPSPKHSSTATSPGSVQDSPSVDNVGHQPPTHTDVSSGHTPSREEPVALPVDRPRGASTVPLEASWFPLALALASTAGHDAVVPAPVQLPAPHQPSPPTVRSVSSR